MSMISKQIDDLEKLRSTLHPSWFSTVDSAIDTIKALSAKIQAQNLHDGWILCEDMMPTEKEVKKNSEYWHCLKSTYCKNTDNISVSDTVLVSVIGEFDNKPRVDKGHTINGIFHVGLCGNDKVIAWMPLPEPYKEN